MELAKKVLPKAMHRQYPLDPDRELPETLKTANAKLVYFYLRQEGEATIDELQAALRMKKIALYPLLQSLTATGHVRRSGEQYIHQQQTTNREHP